MRSQLARLRRLTLDEINWRAREMARTSADRLRAKVATPRWERDDRIESAAEAIVERLRTQPARFVIDPRAAAEVRDAVLARWPDAARGAAARADRIIGGHYDLLGYRGLDVRQADGTIDWHFDPVHHRHAPQVCWADVPYLDPAIGDHKIIWELNRHQHFLPLGRAWWLTGDAKYGAAIGGQMESWLAANPPLTGINWASMLEIGFRAISWTAGLHFLAVGSRQTAVGSEEHEVSPGNCLPPTAYCLLALHQQLTHVEQHLSHYFSPNTHLTGEALALYVVGQAFPELPASERWVATGRGLLLREIDRQILPDGGHAERSTHYQRYTLDFYLLALLTARRVRDVDAERIFTDAVSRLADFTRAMADDEGRLPLIGDDDGGMLWPLMGRECNDVRDSLAVAAIALDRPDLAPWGTPEEALWIASRDALRGDGYGLQAADSRSLKPVARSPVSRTFPDTGYIVMRNGSGDHAVLDAGAHGYMNGGHAHADALALTLTAGGRPLLVDPGTATYTMDQRLRDRMRSSLNHNTIEIDGRPQSTPAGPFHWQTSATARVHATRHNPGFDWAEGAHDGYAPLEHRRSVLRADDAGWLVVDTVAPASGYGLLAPGARSPEARSPQPVARLDAHWHFHPHWMLRADGARRLRATHFDGGDAWLLFDEGELALQHGDDESGLGWFAPVYGTLIPTWTAQITRACRLPASMVTWISSGPLTSVPVLERLDVTGDATHRAIAARVVGNGVAGDAVSTYLIHSGEPAACDGRGGGIDGYQTNARALHLRTRAGALVSLDLADASHALALRDGWISVEASDPVADLHLALADGVLSLAATEPPRELRLAGRALANVRAVLLNGRSCLAPPIDRPDTLLVPGSEWGTPPTAHAGVPFALASVRLTGCEEFLPLRESSW